MWVNVGQMILKWHHKLITVPKDALLVSLMTALKHNSTWPEMCDCACRQKNGFMNDAKLVFLMKKNLADNNDEMDSKIFGKWF
jgi:hypothetical protein